MNFISFQEFPLSYAKIILCNIKETSENAAIIIEDASGNQLLSSLMKLTRRWKIFLYYTRVRGVEFTPAHEIM